MKKELKRREEEGNGTNPDNDFILKRMGKLVSCKQDVGVSVELPEEE